MAVDSGSRTSVQLARIILAHRYGVFPEVVSMDPDLERMLDQTDAALVIGDTALSIDPAEVDVPCLDLGEEWVSLTGLPMVFATWAGRPEAVTPEVTELLHGSLHYGLGELDSIIKEEAERRGFAEEVVHRYLTRDISFYLGPEEEAGLRLYLEYAMELPDTGVPTEMHVHDDAAGSR